MPGRQPHGVYIFYPTTTQFQEIHTFGLFLAPNRALMPGGVIVVCALAVFGIVGLVVAATKLEPSLPKSSSKKKRSSTTPETPAPSIFATTISKVAQRFGAEDPLRRHQEPARSHEHPTPPSQRTTADEAALAVESTHATGPQSTPTPSNLQSVPLIQFESDSDHSSTPLATPTVLEQFDPYYGTPLSPLGSPIASKPLGRDAGNPHPTAPRSQYPLLEVPQGSSGGSSPHSPSNDSAYRTAIESPLSADSFHSARSSVVFSPPSQRNSLSLDEAASRVAAGRLDIHSWSTMVQPQETGPHRE